MVRWEGKGLCCGMQYDRWAYEGSVMGWKSRVAGACKKSKRGLEGGGGQAFQGGPICLAEQNIVMAPSILAP